MIEMKRSVLKDLRPVIETIVSEIEEAEIEAAFEESQKFRGLQNWSRLTEQRRPKL